MINFFNSFFDNLKLNARFNLFIAALLIIIFSSLGFYLYSTQKQEIFNNSDKQLRVLLEDLINIFEVQTNMKLDNIKSTMRFAEYLYNNKGGIQQSDSNTVTVTIINSETGISREEQLPAWYLDGKLLQESTQFVDFIKEFGVEAVTFFQKSSEGFVMVSTTMHTVKDEENKEEVRAKGALLPRGTEVERSIAQKDYFIGRAYIVDGWYLASFMPVYINGEVQGLIAIAEKQMDYEILKPIFYNKTYLENGYPYVVSGDGFSVINPSGIEGTDLNGSKFFKLLVDTKNDNQEAFRYFWPEDPKLGRWKWTYFKYFQPLDAYIATSILEEELFTGLTKIRNGILFGVVISIIVFFIGISFIIRPMTNSIKQLVQIISTMSKGIMVEKIYYNRRDEIGDIIDSLNTLINGLTQTARFSNDIEKGNYRSEFTPLSVDDTLGNALLDMRESLQNAKDEDEKRKKEDAKRKWASDGLALFSDILRQNTENIDTLASQTISNLVRYLKASQGGLFIINDDNKPSVTLKLAAAFAYDQKKHFEKEILFGEGLVGTCAIEKETIYLSEIPDDYIEISSGLGQAKPNNLVIVPLKLNDMVLGVIEIATFTKFEPFEIEFIEKLAEGIASTLAAAKVNERTTQLLKEAQLQSEAMASQEEEMRQNLEELQTTQEESARRQAEMTGVIMALDNSFLVAELNMNGEVLKMNDKYLKVFKLPIKQVVGKHQQSLYRLSQSEIIKNNAFWEELNAGKSKARIQHLNLEGEEHWLSETYTPIFDNNGIPYKVLNITVDITDSKKQEIEIQQLLNDSRKKAKKLAAQEQLNSYNVEKLERMQVDSAKREAEMTSILDSIDNIALRGELTIDGQIINVNTNYLRKLEYSLDEMKFKDTRLFIPEDELEEFDTIWKSTVKGNKHDGIFRRITKGGKDVWLLLSYTPVKDKNGNITKVLFLAYDISKQKLNETRIKNHAMKMLEKNKKLRLTVKKLEKIENELNDLNITNQGLKKALQNSSWLVVFNGEGELTEITDFAIKKLKTDKETIFQKTLQDFVNPKTKEQVASYKRFLADLKEGKSINQIKCNIENEVATWLSETYTPVFNSEGKLFQIVLIIHDMSHSVPANEQENFLKLMNKTQKN